MRKRVALIALLGSVCLGYTRDVSAKPPVWSAIRRPQAAAREVAIDHAQKVQSDAILQKRRIKIYSGLPIGDEMVQAGQIEARELLEKAGGATSPNPMVRLHYAIIVHGLASKQRPRNLRNIEEATRILETVIAARPAPSALLIAWSEIAICYALLGQRDKEIHAYGQAMLLEPVGPRRAMLSANRAESYMGQGRLEEAIRGYREAIASLLPDEIEGYGVSTFWGLGVALDRNGDLEEGLDHIRIARTYDKYDEAIGSDSWFYSPPHDEHWYKALGAWEKARAAATSFDAIFEFGHALEAWDRYIEIAPKDDPYVALAKARRRACELERERAARTTPKH